MGVEYLLVVNQYWVTAWLSPWNYMVPPLLPADLLDMKHPRKAVGRARQFMTLAKTPWNLKSISPGLNYRKS